MQASSSSRKALWWLILPGATRRWRHWPKLHLAGMGASYIFLLTAFYVDNGKNLPLWNKLPEFAFWLLPGAIGVPLIVYALLRHPLVRAYDAAGPTR